MYKGEESVSQLKCILWLEENVSHATGQLTP